MTMTNPSEGIALVPVFVAGLLLGALVFGGLWWTVRRVLAARLSALWLIASFVARIALVLVGFIVVAGDQWQRWLVVLAGFVAARIVIARLLPAPDVLPVGTLSPGAGHHAP
jgi:F1F0 ATPase subunit 2